MHVLSYALAVGTRSELSAPGPLGLGDASTFVLEPGDSDWKLKRVDWAHAKVYSQPIDEVPATRLRSAIAPEPAEFAVAELYNTTVKDWHDAERSFVAAFAEQARSCSGLAAVMLEPTRPKLLAIFRQSVLAAAERTIREYESGNA